MEDRVVLVVRPVPDRLVPADSVLLALGKDPAVLAPVDPVAQQAAQAHVRAVPEADLVVPAHVPVVLVADPVAPAHVLADPVVPVDILVLQGLVPVRLESVMRLVQARAQVQVLQVQVQVQPPDSARTVHPDRVAVIVPVVVALAVVPLVVVRLAVITTGIKIINLKVMMMMIAQKTQSSLKVLFLPFLPVPCSV